MCFSRLKEKDDDDALQNRRQNLICIIENIFPLHKTENLRCTKRKIYTAENGKYTLHKREIRCTKENTDYINGKWHTLPGFHKKA